MCKIDPRPIIKIDLLYFFDNFRIFDFLHQNPKVIRSLNDKFFLSFITSIEISFKKSITLLSKIFNGLLEVLSFPEITLIFFSNFSNITTASYFSIWSTSNN